MPSDDFARQRSTMTISSAVRKSDGVCARVVAPETPAVGAYLVDPTLEDAFLYTLNYTPAPPAEGSAE